MELALWSARHSFASSLHTFRITATPPEHRSRKRLWPSINFLRCFSCSNHRPEPLSYTSSSVLSRAFAPHRLPGRGLVQRHR